MASNYQDVPVTFEKGLATENEESVLDDGQASEITNWEPASYGGLRTRNAWDAISTDGLTADYKVRGWGVAAIGSGAGSAAPAIVQKATDTNTPLSSVALTCTLNGVTPGNILVVVVYSEGSPPDIPASGYTLRGEADQTLGLQPNASIWTKTATLTTETCTMDDANPVMLAMVMYELSNVTTEAPTAFDTILTTGSDTTSVTSASLQGIAISAGAADGSTWVDPPGGTGWTTDVNHTDSGVLFTVASKIYGTDTITDTMDATGTSQATAGITAIWDAGSGAGTPQDFYILLAVATSTGYSIYRIPRDQIRTGTWEFIDSAICADTSAFVSMAVGSGVLVWSASTMDNPRHIALATLVADNTTDLASKAGRAVCFHKDRMFVAGSSAFPSRVYFSDIGAPTSFTTATDFMDVGGDDGEAIEDLMSVEGLLLVCKVNRLYLISGSGVESFFVNELPGGSASTGRAAIRTPYGTVVAGPADVWNVQGGGVDPLARPLGVGYNISGLVSTAYAQDVVLIADSATGKIFRVNLVTGAWSTEAVTEGENEPGHLFSLQSRLYYGVSNSATQVGGTRRLSSARGPDFTGSTSYTASTGRISLQGPAFKYTPRYLYFQLRLQDATKSNFLNVNVETNHGSRDFHIDVVSNTQRETRAVAWATGAQWVKINLSCSSSSTHSAIDVERLVLGVDLEAPI